MRLKINRWPELYENHVPPKKEDGKEKEPRRKKPLDWYATPLRQEDGVGAQMIREHPKGMAFMGIWNALCKTTARLHLDQRGYILRENGTPHTVKTLHIAYRGADLELWQEAIEFFLQPDLGWLTDEDAVAIAPAAKVIAMPLPKIEEPSIYELAADRMIARYVNADAPVDRIPDTAAVAKAIMFRAEGKGDEAIELMEDNQQAYIEATSAKFLTRLDHWISGGLSLATRKGPKKLQRGKTPEEIEAEWKDTEAMIRKEVDQGHMTKQQALETYGVQV